MLPFPKRADSAYRKEYVNRVFGDPLYIDIINSKTFRRLKLISFLGAIEYILRPSSIRYDFVHNRFNHSIGVARLALRYSYIKSFPKEKERALVVYALIHDIGHFPLSHTLEEIFTRRFSLDHRLTSLELARGKLEGRTELKEILDHHDVSEDEIIPFFDNEETGEVIFSGPFNLDTLEGISRSFSALGRDYIGLDASRLLRSTLLERSSVDRKLFWESKSRIYNQFINGPIGMAADTLSSIYFSETKKELNIIDTAINDRKFFQRHHDFMEFLKKTSEFMRKDFNNIPKPIRQRHFFIDGDDAGETDARYQTTKIKCLDNLDAWKALFYRIYERKPPTQFELFDNDIFD